MKPSLREVCNFEITPLRITVFEAPPGSVHHNRRMEVFFNAAKYCVMLHASIKIIPMAASMLFNMYIFSCLITNYMLPHTNDYQIILLCLKGILYTA